MNHLSDELLNEYLDDAVSDRVEVESHLAQCVDCEARLTSLQTFFAEIGSLPEEALSRDLAAAITRRVRGSNAIPRWLTLTVALQGAAALIAAIVAAPFVIEFASSSLPALQAPSPTGILIQLQAQWTQWLDTLSQFEVPVMPEIPVFEVSSLYFLLAVAGVSMFWLVGNGLLLRNQIK
jgi:anti-sigma factor RsiW